MSNTKKKKRNYSKKNIELVKKNNKIKRINDRIQSVTSIIYTIIIIVLFIFLIFVIYQKFFKPKEEINKEEVCSDFIKKDYHIDDNSIIEFIKNNRHIIYNIDKFDRDNINKDTINLFSKFIIWNSDSEYQLCDNEEFCLDTKKEIEYDELKEKLQNYFTVDYLNLIFNYNFKEDDTTRLYLKDNKVILTFKNMQYETYKHDIVDISIDEENIDIIFALSKKNNDIYEYIGSKRVRLIYSDDNYIIDNITSKYIK